MTTFIYCHGSIFESNAQAWVNPVNCVGIMGKGLALEFKKAFPECYKVYVMGCKNEHVRLGKVQILMRGALNPEFIINFPTKNHWKDKSEYENISTGMDDLVDKIENYGITSIAIPALGCGWGGLKWEKVMPIIQNKLKDVGNLQVHLYGPVAYEVKATRS